MWLGEQITERGIGNGASLLIFFSIVERIWPETLRTIEALRARSLTVPVLFLVLGIMVLVVAGARAELVGGGRVSQPHTHNGHVSGAVRAGPLKADASRLD